MNEYSIIMHFLSRARSPENPDQTVDFGASEDELCTILNYTGKNAKVQLRNTLSNFSQAASIFGLVVKQNPFTQNWFVTARSEIQEQFAANPFSGKRRLAATLCTILLLVMNQGGSATYQQAQESRNKKEIEPDLLELEKMEFIIREDGIIRLHPNIGYYLDLNQMLQFIENEKNLKNLETSELISPKSDPNSQ